MTATVDPCPHVCAACGSCPDCCPERHKTTTEEISAPPYDPAIMTKIAGLIAQGSATDDQPDVLLIEEETAVPGYGKSNIIAAKLAELIWKGRLNGDPRHDPHAIDEGSSCAACEVQAVKDAAVLRWSMKRDREAGFRIVDTQAENWAQNWKAITGQTAPDDQPTP